MMEAPKIGGYDDEGGMSGEEELEDPLRGDSGSEGTREGRRGRGHGVRRRKGGEKGGRGHGGQKRKRKEKGKGKGGNRVR